MNELRCHCLRAPGDGGGERWSCCRRARSICHWMTTVLVDVVQPSSQRHRIDLRLVPLVCPPWLSTVRLFSSPSRSDQSRSFASCRGPMNSNEGPTYATPFSLPGLPPGNSLHTHTGCERLPTDPSSQTPTCRESMAVSRRHCTHSQTVKSVNRQWSNVHVERRLRESHAFCCLAGN